MKNTIKTVLLVVTIPLLLLTVLYGGVRCQWFHEDTLFLCEQNPAECDKRGIAYRM